MTLRSEKLSPTRPSLRSEMEDAPVEGDDAGRLLAAMLQRVQAERGDRGGVGMAVDAEDAAFLAQRVAVEVEIAGRSRPLTMLDGAAMVSSCGVPRRLRRAPNVGSGPAIANARRRVIRLFRDKLSFAAAAGGGAVSSGLPGSPSGFGLRSCFRSPSGLSGSMAMSELPVLSSIGRDFALAAHSGILPLGEPGQEDPADHADQEAPGGAEDEAERPVERADAGIEDQVGDLHGDERDDDEGQDEDAADRRDERDRVVGDVLLGIRKRRRVQEPGGGRGRDPGHDGEHLAREAAHRREQRGDQDDADDDEIEDGNGHGFCGRALRAESGLRPAGSRPGAV